jgi:Cu-Zn family superoxide dismutase
MTVSVKIPTALLSFHKEHQLMATLRILSIFSLLFLMGATSPDITVKMNMVDEKGQGKEIGTITFSPAKCGILVTPNLHDLTPGTHGFHVHQHPSCADKAMAAGGHLDPDKSDSHKGPYENKGHLGDLPVLIVDQDGTASKPGLAPKLTMEDIKDHAIMIHLGSDNYSDTPEKLGGGGARIACGVAS